MLINTCGPLLMLLMKHSPQFQERMLAMQLPQHTINEDTVTGAN